MQNGMALNHEEIWMKTRILWYERSLKMDTSIEIINDFNKCEIRNGFKVPLGRRSFSVHAKMCF